MAVPSAEPFSIDTDTTVISAPGGGNYLHIVGLGIHNNDNTGGNDVKVRFLDGSGGSDLFGGASGSAYLTARGGTLELQLSYSNPYWDLSENTGLHLDVSASRLVAGTIWYYTDASPTGAVNHAPFDLTSNTSVISATAGQTIKIHALSIYNNDADLGNDEVVHLTDGSGGTDLYGTSNGAVYLPGAGGHFSLPMSYSDPWLELSTNTALYIDVDNGYRVAGTVWYSKS